MKTLTARIADLLSDRQPRWPPQIAAHIEGGPVPLAAIDTALRAMCNDGKLPLHIVPKRGYTLITNKTEARDAADELEKRIAELRRWQRGLEKYLKYTGPTPR